MTYRLYYWTGIQGRGEFVRLALEDAGADYVDVARVDGDEAPTRMLNVRVEEIDRHVPSVLALELVEEFPEGDDD